MSTNLTMFCKTCDAKGPLIRRTAGASAHLVAWDAKDPRIAWSAWMEMHKWHDIEGKWD